MKQTQAEASLVWHVMRTNPTRERRAQLGLEQWGYRTYLPVLTRTRTQARRTDIVERPLFPGYIFVGRQHMQSFETIRPTDGISDILTNASTPIVLAPRILADLAFAQTTGLFGETKPKARPELNPGDPVRVVAGRLEGFAAKIMRFPCGPFGCGLITP